MGGADFTRHRETRFIFPPFHTRTSAWWGMQRNLASDHVGAKADGWSSWISTVSPGVHGGRVMSTVPWPRCAGVSLCMPEWKNLLARELGAFALGL